MKTKRYKNTYTNDKIIIPQNKSTNQTFAKIDKSNILLIYFKSIDVML